MRTEVTGALCFEHPQVSTGDGERAGGGALGNQRLQSRLHRVEGQVRGVQRMVDDDRSCVEVLTQIAAARGALLGVAMQLIEVEVGRCIDGGSHADPQALADLQRAVGRLLKT